MGARVEVAAAATTRVGGLTGGFRCVWGAVSPGAVFVFVFHLGGGCPQKGRGGVHLTRDQKRSAQATGANGAACCKNERAEYASIFNASPVDRERAADERGEQLAPVRRRTVR